MTRRGVGFPNGEIEFSALQSEQGGIVGTYTGKDNSHSFRGDIGELRVLK